MQVLIVKTSSMGDILHTLPALTDAANVLSNIHFDWVVEENFIQIPEWHPKTYRIIPVAIRRWCRNWLNASIRKERLIFKKKLQQVHYDVIIDAQGLIKSALFITRIAFGEKHGFDFNSAKEPFASCFYDQRHNINKKEHAIKRIRQLFAKSLGYLCPTTKVDYAIKEKYFSLSINKGTYLIFLHATTRYEKHWPENFWRELIQLAINAGHYIKLPWGTKKEYLQAQRLALGFTEVEVLPSLSLEEIAVQLANARAIVSVDTGLSHLAAALEKPNLVLYGPTDPKLIGNYGSHQQLLCAERGSMENLSVGCVWEKLQFMLKNS